MRNEESPAKTLNPAATDETSANAREGARRRRDPTAPAGAIGLGASAGGIATSADSSAVGPGSSETVSPPGPSGTAEQYEASTEQLKVFNDELQATNEALRSATEELETSKDELQSVNEELTTVNNELKNSVEDLRRANSDLHNLMASTDIGTIFLDRQLRIQHFTPSAQKIFNLVPADIQRPLFDVTHKLNDSDVIADALAVLDNLRTIEREVRLGEENWYWVRIAPYRTAGDRIAGVVATFIEITRRKGAEEELRESEARYRAMFEQAHIGIVQVAADGHFLAVNPGACALSGYTETELLRMSVKDVTHPEDVPKEEALTAKLFAGEIADYTLEKRFMRKDGVIVWGNMTATLVRKETGEALYVLAIVEAIEERKRTEQQLRDSEELFRGFAENSADVLWILDLENQRVEYISPAYETMWGEPREASMKDAHHWTTLIHPDDREKVSARQVKMRMGETVVTDYRIIRPSDHEVRWVRDTGFTITKRDGKVSRIGGVVQEVTADKTFAEDLRRSEERFRLLVDGARDYAMFLIDPENVITFWSKGAERVFGWTWEEAIGQKGEFIFVPEDRANGAVENEIETARTAGRAPDRRFHLRKDGSRFWADGVLMRLNDEQGQLRGFAKVARDASDQRAVEDALRSARDEFELRVVERTRDLTATNRELERAMSQRQELEKELLQISEREKRRIGEDLHDMVCQELTATALFLRSSAVKLADISPDAAETLEESAQIVNRNVGLTRDLARGLQPAELKGSGLKQALRDLADKANENAEIKCHFKAARGASVTDETIALNLYRVAQEALNNAIKHSGAKNILIALDHNRENVCVCVQDDGTGFSPKRRSKGLGLHIMRYRANALGGELKIEKRKHGGMDITCVIPRKG